MAGLAGAPAYNESLRPDSDARKKSLKEDTVHTTGDMKLYMNITAEWIHNQSSHPRSQLDSLWEWPSENATTPTN